MPLEIWITFVVASMALLIIPGPTTLTVISYALSHGKHANITLIMAVTLGDTTALALSLLGLGTLLAKSAFWFTVIKWLGGLYLIYLGIKLMYAGVTVQNTVPSTSDISARKLFVNTYLITALNPKGMMFFMAFFPQFLTPNINVNQQLWILASTFAILAMCNAMFYSNFAVRAQGMLSSPLATKYINITGGTLMTCAGLWSLTSKRVS